MSKIQERRKLIKQQAASACSASHALMIQAGVDPVHFGAMLGEAILTNPGIVDADMQSLSMAVRDCCQYGMVPNGDQAVITVFGGKATMIPMKNGLKRLAYERIGVEVRSGVIYEGDDFEIVTGSHGAEERIVIRMTAESLANRKPENLVAAWASIQLPDETHPRLTIYSRHQIENIKPKGAKNKPGSAWARFEDKMWEKVAVKRAINELRHRAGGKDLLGRAIDHDNAVEGGDIIDIDAGAAPRKIEVEPEPEPPREQPSAEASKPAPRKQPAKKKAVAKKAEAGPAPEPEAGSPVAEPPQSPPAEAAAEEAPEGAEPPSDEDMFPIGGGEQEAAAPEAVDTNL